MTDEETRLTRLVADQGAQIARLTQNASVHKLILEQVKHDLKQERAAVERAVAEERAAVVAWLRTVAPNAPTRRGADELEWCANAIERGEYIKEKT